MTNLTELLNIEAGNNLEFKSNGVIFCANNLKERFACHSDYVIEALNNAGYYEEDDDFDAELVDVLCEIVDQTGIACALEQVTEKQIWFDSKN